MVRHAVARRRGDVSDAGLARSRRALPLRSAPRRQTSTRSESGSAVHRQCAQMRRAAGHSRARSWVKFRGRRAGRRRLPHVSWGGWPIVRRRCAPVETSSAIPVTPPGRTSRTSPSDATRGPPPTRRRSSGRRRPARCSSAADAGLGGAAGWTAPCRLRGNAASLAAQSFGAS